jgi:hypothetical protein
MSKRHKVEEGMKVTNEEGKITMKVDLTLGEMKLRDVLLREISKVNELKAALEAQLADLDANAPSMTVAETTTSAT